MPSPRVCPARAAPSQIIATVQDTGGNALSGVPVTFTTTTGTLSPGTATSGSDGRAISTLTTNQDATVTVTAGAKTGTAAITASAVPTVTITPPATTPSVGVSSNFSFNITPGNAAAPIRTVIVDWDDGRVQSLGAASGSITVPHTFLDSGTFEVTATATDALNQTTSVTAPVDVFPAVPFTLSVSASSGRVNSPITITATAPVGSPVIVAYEWNLGAPVVGDADGIVTTSIPTVTAVYPAMPCSHEHLHGPDHHQGDRSRRPNRLRQHDDDDHAVANRNSRKDKRGREFLPSGDFRPRFRCGAAVQRAVAAGVGSGVTRKNPRKARDP